VKLLKIILILFFFFVFTNGTFAEEKKSACADIKSDTGVSLVKKLWCKSKNKEWKLKNPLKKKESNN
tara:strand:+ start:735 stop:935 length:201 start_codon:yes stop_codon:yes gene_type:complete